MCEVVTATYMGRKVIERMKTYWVVLEGKKRKNIEAYTIKEEGLYVRFGDNDDEVMLSAKSFNFFFENTFVDYEPQKKAYHVWDKTGEGDEAGHEVVFAETSRKAIKMSQAFGMSGYMEDMCVERQPHFDKYSDTQKIPFAEMMRHGWLYECLWCSSFTDNDSGEVVDESVICDDCIYDAEKEARNESKVD